MHEEGYLLQGHQQHNMGHLLQGHHQHHMGHLLQGHHQHHHHCQDLSEIKEHEITRIKSETAVTAAAAAAAAWVGGIADAGARTQQSTRGARRNVRLICATLKFF